MDPSIAFSYLVNGKADLTDRIECGKELFDWIAAYGFIPAALHTALINSGLINHHPGTVRLMAKTWVAGYTAQLQQMKEEADV